MDIDFQKVADAIEKSTQDTKNLMFSVELGEKIKNVAISNDLDEETFFKLSDEVGYVILDLKSRSTFFDSLVDIGIDKVAAQKIANIIDTEIFIELNKIENKAEEKKKESKDIEMDKINNESNPEMRGVNQKLIETPKTRIDIEPSSNVGEDFEQIILNQVRAMQPAREAGSSQQPASSSQVEDSSKQQVASSQEEEKPKTIHNYVSGSDPYRESVE